MRAKAAASAAAFVALVAVAGAGAFVVARDEPEPPATTTSSTTSTTVPDARVADALATALADGLDVPLSEEQSRCLGEALLTTVGRGRLEALAGGDDPISSLPEADRSALVRDVVTCVGPDSAAALLGASTTTTGPVAFPDAGEE